MNLKDVNYAKDCLINKIKSLENDYKRAYFNLNQYKIQPSPFPILMFTMSVLDFLSALLKGWSESSPKMKKFQTNRMIDFCVINLGYGQTESNVLVKVHRHSLMHTSDPRIMRDEKGRLYSWRIMPINSNHMRLNPINNTRVQVNILDVGIGNLINDLKMYLIKRDGYFESLDNDTQIQSNYAQCLQELDCQTI
ncbi:hypothetical protein HY214_01240 [Candidatus Roizmanbacteria bacterium]|nr:hypothetical protein [Candidatus Roizmanbacteria bacterium]